MTARSFFTAADEWFEATPAARGPWDADACHAGPAAGLIARALEQMHPNRQLTRLTMEVARPIPMAGFTIRTEAVRTGWFVATTAATLIDRDEEVCCVASAMHLTPQDLGDVPSAAVPVPPFDEMEPGEFPIRGANHDLPHFVEAMDVGYPPGETREPGPTTLWMRALPILEGEPASPFQRLCPLADCGNGISRNAELAEVTFMNTDLTLTMHRPPVGDWLASSATSHWQSTGVGLAHATLFDTTGPVGLATQTLLLRRPA